MGAFVEGLGQRYEINAVYHKPYPCCRHYHAVIDGIKELQREHGFKANDVEHADIGMYAVGFNGHDYKHCDSLLDAQMSAPVAAALAIVLGDVTATMFVPATLDRPDVRALIERVDTKIDEECERIYPGVRSGSARIILRDGRVLEKRVLDPKARVKNPMTDADLEAKFRANCEPLLGGARCERMLADVWKFDQAGRGHAILQVGISWSAASARYWPRSGAYRQRRRIIRARPIRFVVPLAPAGAGDIVARTVAAKLSELWGQQIVIDNRPGANTIIGTDLVAKSKPDGYTWLLGVQGSLAINPATYPSLPYDPEKDFDAVTQMTVYGYVLVVHPALPVKSVAELIALARSRPGELAYGTSGNGGSNHLAGESFRLASASGSTRFLTKAARRR